jgi:OOP family OmpA-OmpF porin
MVRRGTALVVMAAGVAMLLPDRAGAQALADGAKPGAAARSKRSTELGVFVGVHTIASDTNLVRLENMPNSTPTTGVPLGLRLGFSVHEHIGIDLEGTMQYSATNDREGSGFVAAYRGLLRWRISGDDARVRPFVIVGGGAMSGYVSRPLRSDSSTEVMGTVGGGVEIGLGRRVGLRLDARAHVGEGHDGLTTDVEVALGICWAPGGSCGYYRAPRLEQDIDVDVDAGGTPLDSDEDGIFGRGDKCPLRPEDQDGFQDDDGCPEPDNDKDGVADTDDQCPVEAERRNGFNDSDGCPDDVPEVFGDFDGIVAGVVFRPGTAGFDPRSYDVLDRLAAALLEYPNVKLKIVSHTFAGPDAAADATLTAQRADAVKQYLVDKGVNEARLEAVGVGAESPIADDKTAEGRAINERIELRLVR